MRQLAHTSRLAGIVALLTLGALALHELRYRLAFGGSAGAELERTGHGYLDLLAPLIVAAAVAALIVSVVVPVLLRAAPSLGRSCLTERAAGYAAALVAVHLAQELAEGFFHAGHEGIAHVSGAGGVLVLPLAMALGALAAFAHGWLERAERRLVVALDRPRLPRAPRWIGSAPPRQPDRKPLTALGLRFGIARRPPPPAQLG